VEERALQFGLERPALRDGFVFVQFEQRFARVRGRSVRRHLACGKLKAVALV
jgi:hypothetical protein